MNTTSFTFAQLNEALQACTPCCLTVETDEDGDKGYALRDGCGDYDGSLFYDLFDVEDYITNNEDVQTFLDQYN